MQAVVIHGHGGVEELVLEPREIPEPGPGEIRVAMGAVGVNHLDLWVRRGVPGHRFPLPIVPGADGAGVVESIGPGVARPSVGDRVLLAPGVSCGACAACAAGNDNLCRHYGLLGESRDGTCASHVVVPAVNALVLPEGMDLATAASFPLVYQTAWHMLVVRARVQAGMRVLVHAAGSGVSTAAIQIARLVGAEVLATAGSDEKVARARELGAAAAWNYRTTSWTKEVRAATAQRGPDVVVDHVGQETLTGSLAVLPRGGSVVTCGATTGAEVTLDLRRIFFKNLSLLGSTMGSRAELYTLLDLVAAGRLRPVIDRVLPLARIQEAHALLENRSVFGKVVLEV